MSTSKHSAGPWYWVVNEASRQVELRSAKHDTVMAFRRWGMNGATVMFCLQGILEPARKFAKVVKGREHHASWFQDVGHPDARLIAAAPDLLDVLQRLTEHIDICDLDSYHDDWHDALKAIAKATGGDAPC